MNEKIDWSKYKQEYVEKNVTEDYVFYDQIEKIKKIMSTNAKNEVFNCIDNNKFNRLIGISGERGSGKSSLLKTLEFNFKNNNNNNNNYYFLPIIDPNKLDHQLGILETILSNLYLAVEKKRSELCNPSNEYNEVSRKIVNQIGIVSKLAISKKDFRNHYSNEEILEQYHRQLLFEDDFHELFKDVWSLLKEKSKESYQRGYLIILIDDIDLVGNDLVYMMLEDIKKVLSNNVTTILTYRNSQLHNAIFDSKIRENRELLNHKMIDEHEIRLQTSTYIEKMFIQTQVVKMPIKEEVIDLSLGKLFYGDDILILKNKEFKPEDSIIKNIYEVFKKRTLINIYSLDINERALYESSITLRGVIQTLEFLCEDLIPLYINSLAIEKNIIKTKKYFLNLSEELLDIEERRIIDKWDFIDSKSKNYIIYKELYNQLIHENNNISEDIEELLAIDRIEAYNVCLGDVISIFNDYKESSGSNLSKYHFIYTMKILYSIELLLSLITEIFKEKNDLYTLKFELSNGEIEQNYYFKDLNNEDNKLNLFWNTKYYHLTRYKIIPESVTWFAKKSDKLVVKYTGENLNFYDKIFYTSIAVEGDTKISRIKISDLNSNSYLMKQDPHRYRYRYYFLFRFNASNKLHESDEIKMKEHSYVGKNKQYPFDPYSYLIKEKYLFEVGKKFNYLFYSLFDIDIILTKSHDNKRGKGYEDLLKSVNDVVDKVLVNKYNLSAFIYEKNDDNAVLYEKNDISTIKKVAKEILDVLDPDEMNELGNELLRLYSLDSKRRATSRPRNKKFSKYAESKLYNEDNLSEDLINALEILTQLGEKSSTTQAERDAMKIILNEIKKNKDNDANSDEKIDDQ